MKTWLISLVPLAATGVASAAGTFPTLWRVEGDAAGDWFGYAVGALGDVDGDGICDFGVGAHQNLDGGHSPNPGYARWFSGATGAELRTLYGDGTQWIDGPDDHFGQSIVGLGDLDGDGLSDVVIGAYKDDNVAINTGMIRVFSGASGALLHQADGESGGDRMGIACAALGDVDGDGVPDYATGVYKDDDVAYNAGAAWVLSGATHQLLFKVDGVRVGAAMGWSVANAGDVDGDGVNDVIAGAPQDDVVGFMSGSARLHSGANGALLLELFGDGANDRFGHAVAGVGDVDGDGLSDIAVAAIQSDLTGNGFGPGYVRVFRGLDGAVLLEVSGEEFHEQFGFALAAAGDVDADGHADLLVGAPRRVSLGAAPSGLPGRALVLSGRDGRRLATFVGEAPDDQFGAALARLPDLDGDGIGEFLFGAPEDVPGQSRPGYAVVVSGGLVVATRHCTAAPNSAGSGALLSHSGSFSVAAGDLELFAYGVPPHHYGLFYAGTASVEVPFGDGFRCVGGATRRLGVVGSGALGTPSLEVDLASLGTGAVALLPGTTWSFQLWYRDIPAGLSGFNLTDAIRATILP